MFKRKGKNPRRKLKVAARSSWTSAGMSLTFRAEVMPGRDSTERTYTVMRMLASGRVELNEIAGQHSETEFEPVR
ncbi:MAG: hypothetical protein WBP93_22420 [Pyrinomonadaceae bacterium]